MTTEPVDQAAPIALAPSPVVRAFGGATVAFECMACHRLYAVPLDASAFFLQGKHRIDWARDEATECCGPWRCDAHGKTLKRSQSCDDCSREKRAQKEAETFGRAKKIPLAEYDGLHLHRDGFGRDGFFRGDEIEDMRGLAKVPTWAFACDSMRVSESDCDLTDHVAEGILADHHEDASEWVDQDKIDQASKLVFEACKDVCSYVPDESVVVLLGVTEK